MIIVRITLYLICIISVGWSILVFGGPPIIKRIISGYTNGALTPSGITVSPRLNISIDQLEFIYQNEIPEQPIEGFSRATEIEWSIFGQKPFVKIKVGPSVIKDHATFKRLNIHTPSFQEINWQSISLFAMLDSLAAGPYGKINSLTFVGNLNLEPATVSNVNIEAKEFKVLAGGSTYSADILKSRLSELNINVPIQEQLFSSTFVLENVMFSEFDLKAPEATVEVVLKEDFRNLKIAVNDLKFQEFGGSVKNLKVQGNFNRSNMLEELKINISDGTLSKKLPNFSRVSVTVNKSGIEKYKFNIEGDYGRFDLLNSGNFIGSLPDANFVIDSELDLKTSKLTGVSKINLNPSSGTDITGAVTMGFRSELLTKLKCELADCELSDFDLSYKVNFDEEWLMGSASCPKNFCTLKDMDHSVKTSNTVNIFTILNDEKMLSPLSSLYLYGAISSGEKIKDGHELKFHF